MRRLTFVFATALLAASPAQAGEELLFGPPPEWVEPLPPAQDPGDESTLPVRFLRMDRQTRMEGERQTIYSAITFKIQSSQGLDAGNLSFPWRPETDDLTIHRLAIRRGAETIDVLASGQTFTTLRREQNLDQATLDGMLTANMFPEDLQVGDVLEIATSVTSIDPTFGGHSEELVGPLNFQLDHLHVRLMWPASSRVRLAKTDDLPAWRRSKEDGYEVAELELEDLEPVPLPRDAPLRYSLVRFIQASDFASWSDLAAIEAPLYVKAAQVPAEGPLRTEVERIRESSPDPVKQAEAALQLVQRRVRYVLLAIGEGGYVPADATLTWSRRFGDCKGKTALLLAILGELGIEAEAVLVNTVLGDSLPSRLPSVGAFDHVLVRATIGGREYWLDGTRTGDTSLEGLTVPYFDWGLPLRASGAELVEMMPAPLSEPNADLAIHMDASQGVRAPVPARIELVLRADEAVGMNLALAGEVGEARERALREYWRNRFEFVEPRNVSFTFDEAVGEARLLLEGQATLEWEGPWYETDETGVGYEADFTREPGPYRDAPYAVAYPFYSRTHETIVLPPDSNFNSNNFTTGAEVSETVAGIEYRRHASIEGNTFVIERTVRSVAPQFAASEAPAYEKRLRELRDRRVYLRLPNNYRSTESDSQVAASAAPSTVSELIIEGNRLLDAGESDEAVALFTRATELEPANAWAWANRGIGLAQKGSLDEAQIDFNRATAIDPDNPVAFRGRGLVALSKLDYPAAIAAFTTALEIDPENTFAWGRRAMAHSGNNQHELALADAAEAIKRLPQYVEMYSLRAYVLMSTNKRTEAGREIEAMLAANPDNPLAATVAGNIYGLLGRTEEARALVEQSLNIRPNPMTLVQRSLMRDPADTAGKMADLDEALRLDPDYFPAIAERANLRAAAGDTEGALADTAAALERHPELYDLYLLKADLAGLLGRKDEAVTALDTLVTKFAERPPTFVRASRIYAGLGMYQQAVAAIDKALALTPDPYLYLDRSAAQDPADFDSRLADIETALRSAPNYGDGLIAKAQLLTDHGASGEAVKVWGQALALQPSNPVLLTQRGITQARAGRNREAERDFAQARTAANAMGAWALNAICYAKATAGIVLERALDECEASLRLQPDHAPTLDSRGTVLLQMGRLDEAIRDFDRVLEQTPDAVPSRYLRAVARSRKGDVAGAAGDAAAARTGDRDTVVRLERVGFVLAPTGETVTAAD